MDKGKLYICKTVECEEKRVVGLSGLEWHLEQEHQIQDFGKFRSKVESQCLKPEKMLGQVEQLEKQVLQLTDQLIASVKKYQANALEQFRSIRANMK